MFHPPQVPYGYTVVGPTQPKRSNGPGLAALIIGIIAVITAFIPFVNFFAFLLGPAGVILGIIGLVLADRPRRMAAWGLILSVASMVLAFILIFVYTFGAMFLFGNAIDYSTLDAQGGESSRYTAEPIVPLALGTLVDLTDADGASVFEATVSASVLDASDVITADGGSAEAPAGMKWAMATVDLTVLSASNLPSEPIAVDYIAADGEYYSDLDAYAVPPEHDLSQLQRTLALGESGTAFVIVAIPTTDATGGLWSIQYGSEQTGTAEYFFDPS